MNVCSCIISPFVITKQFNAFLGFSLVMRYVFLLSLVRLTNARNDTPASVPMKRNRVQRFGAKSVNEETMPLLSEKKERWRRLSDNEGSGGGTGGGLEQGGVADGEGTWKGDFAE